MTTATLHHAIDHVPDITLRKRLKRGVYQFDEHGELEKRCSTCREYWPADSEFFNRTTADPDGLHCMCKSCSADSTLRSRINHLHKEATHVRRIETVHQ